MGIVFRQSVKTSLVIFTGAVLGAIVIWLSTKYIVDKQQFGFTRNLTNQAIVLAQLVLLGLQNTVIVQIHKYLEQHEKRKVLITSALVIPVLFLIIISLLYLLFKPIVLNHFQPQDIPYISRYFYLLPIYVLLFTYQIALEQYLISQLKVAVAAFMREVVVRVLNIAVILLFGFGYINFDVLVIGTVAIYVVPVFIYFVLALKTEAFGISFNINAFSKTELKFLVHFSWYHFLLTLSMLLMSSMDVLALPFYDKKGLSTVAIYAIAVFIISFLQMPFKAMAPATFTMLSKAFADEDIDKAQNIFKRSSINILIATTLMGILIACNISNAVALINNGYSAVAVLFMILLIGKFIDLSTGMNDQVLSITNYYKFNFYLSLVLMVILFGMLRILIPIYGVYGAAWSSTITLILFNIAKFVFVWRKLGMQPYSAGSVKIVVAGAVTAAAGYFVPYVHDPYTDTVVRTGIIIAVYVGGLFVLKPSPDLTEYIASIKKNRRLF